jgi:DnaK suppressor protein
MATTKPQKPSKNSISESNKNKVTQNVPHNDTKDAANSTAQKTGKKTTTDLVKNTAKTTMKKTVQPAAKDPQPAPAPAPAAVPTKKRAALIATIKDRLLKERDDLLRGLTRKESPNEISSHGDLVDQSTNFSEHEVMLGLAEHDRNRLQEINHALEKIDKGTYGVCEMSGELISDERLMAMPTARYSVKCQAKMEGYG